MTDAPERVAEAPSVSARRANVGDVAFRAALVLAAASLLLSIVLGILGAPFVIRNNGGPHFNFQFGDPNPAVSLLGLAGPLHMLFGSVAGAWIIVQSIVAISLNRSRRAAVVALAVAVLVPGVSVVVYLLIMLLPR